MKKRKNFLSLLSLSAFIVMIFSVISCSETETTDSTDFALYYMGVTDIGPSMNYHSGTPTYIGPKPNNFRITEVLLEGTSIVTDCFTIDPETGVLSIANSENLSTGTYQFTISCMAGGAEHIFPAAITVNMLPAVPDGVTCKPSEITLEYADVMKSDAKAQITTDGNHVSIVSYAVIQEEGKEYFTVSKTGEISINKSYKGNIPPGVHSVSLKLTTNAGDCIFENAVTFNITSKPLNLTYVPSQSTLEVGHAFASEQPEVVASQEGLKYSISKIEPATDQVQIDPTTGVISVADKNSLKEGDRFVIDVEVSNTFGTNVFKGIYQLDVVAFINPISNFAYETQNVIEATAFTIKPAEGMVGDQVTYSLENNLNGQLTIDRTTGVISAAKGNRIPVGTHKISVKAKNVKSEATAELTIVVTENLNNFSYIRFGNNLGLAPAENYANQFRVTSANEFGSLRLTPTTDIKSGAKVKWSVTSKLNMSKTQIDENTGELTFSAEDWKSAACGLILVTATTGKGTSTEVKLSVPVFFNFSAAVAGANILYKPFVVQINPKAGGVSESPELVGVADVSKFLMDYRRTFNYYNFNGPASHVDGQPSVKGSFMNQMWTKYYQSVGSATVNTGSRQPMSYIDNNGVQGRTLSQALAYIDATSLSLHVNPNKFIDDDGEPANGALIGQITFTTDGTPANVAKGSQIFPVIIWFDSNF